MSREVIVWKLEGVGYMFFCWGFSDIGVLYVGFDGGFVLGCFD